VYFLEGDIRSQQQHRDEHERRRRIAQAKKDLIEQKRQQIEYERAAKLRAQKNAINYSESMAKDICLRISSGELLINICDDNDESMPTVRLCHLWLKEHDDFNALYVDSLQDRLRIFEEQVIQIADDMQNDFKIITKKGVERRVPDPDMVMRAKLRIDPRFRHLKAGMPQKWGDISTLNLKTDDLDAKNLSMEDLSAKSAISSARPTSEAPHDGAPLMPIDDDRPLESPQERAKRIWTNHRIEKSFKEQRKAITSDAGAPQEHTPAIADTIKSSEFTRAKLERRADKIRRDVLSPMIEDMEAKYQTLFETQQLVIQMLKAKLDPEYEYKKLLIRKLHLLEELDRRK
jgi:hypothetical protein